MGDMDDRARILARCEPDTNGGCLLWTGAVKENGYGMAWSTFNGISQTRLVHRIAFGLERAKGKAVRHTCDVSVCCNPNHLILGDHSENMADMVERGRQSNGASYRKTTQAERDDMIRDSLSGMSIHAISRKTGRDRATVRVILQNAAPQPEEGK